MKPNAEDEENKEPVPNANHDVAPEDEKRDVTPEDENNVKRDVTPEDEKHDVRGNKGKKTKWYKKWK